MVYINTYPSSSGNTMTVVLAEILPGWSYCVYLSSITDHSGSPALNREGSTR